MSPKSPTGPNSTGIAACKPAEMAELIQVAGVGKTNPAWSR